MEEPAASNGYHSVFASNVVASFKLRTGRELLESRGSQSIGAALFHAPYAVVSHGTQADPIFNYGNLAALELFGMSWEEFTTMPSRLSAEPVEQDERDRLMAEAIRAQCIDDFTAVRISKLGRRFQIEHATLWTVADDAGVVLGQAAVFPSWRFLDEPPGPRAGLV